MNSYALSSVIIQPGRPFGPGSHHLVSILLANPASIGKFFQGYHLGKRPSPELGDSTSGNWTLHTNRPPATIASMSAPATVPNLPDSARLELEEVYRDVDEQVRSLGVACWARGDCCNFERAEHRLYASTVEVAYVAETRGRTHPAGSCLCPFWKEGRCTERDRRPLGCRVYHCDARYRVPLEALYESAYRKIRAIADRHEIPWRYGLFVESMRGGQ